MFRVRTQSKKKAATKARVANKVAASKCRTTKKTRSTMTERMRKLAASHVESRLAADLSSVTCDEWMGLENWHRVAAALGGRSVETALKSENGGGGGGGGGTSATIVPTTDLERAIFPQGPLGLHSDDEQHLHAMLRACIAAVLRRTEADRARKLRSEGGAAADDEEGGGGGGNGGGGDDTHRGAGDDSDGSGANDGEKEQPGVAESGDGGGEKETKSATDGAATVTPKLAPHLEAAVRAYTNEGIVYRDLNERLRIGDDVACWMPFVQCLAQACAALPSVTRGVLYRGVNLAASQLDCRYEVGTRRVWTQFVSCSTTRDAALEFADPTRRGTSGVIFRVLTDAGVSLAPWSAFPDENEALLAPPFAFEVVSVAQEPAGEPQYDAGVCGLTTITVRQCVLPTSFSSPSNASSSSCSSSSSVASSAVVAAASSSLSTSTPPSPPSGVASVAPLLKPTPPPSSTSALSKCAEMKKKQKTQKTAAPNGVEKLAEAERSSIDSASGGGNSLSAKQAAIEEKTSSDAAYPTTPTTLSTPMPQTPSRKRSRGERHLLLVNDVRAESDELLDELRAALSKTLRVDALRDVEMLHAATTEEALARATAHRATLCGVVTDVTRRQSTATNYRAGIDLVAALRNDRIAVPVCLYYASATFRPRDLAELAGSADGSTKCTLTTRTADAVEWLCRLLDN